MILGTLKWHAGEGRVAQLTTSIWVQVSNATETLEAYVARGWSASQIAREMTKCFGFVFTPGQVSGRIHRLGLKLTGLSSKEIKERRERGELPPSEKQMSKDRAQRRREVRERAKQQPRPAPVVRAPKEACSFLQIPPGGCHYEVSSGWPAAKDMKFCGQPATGGTDYCQTHREMMVSKRWPL